MNHLTNQQSAYLKQHCNQPVDWYPWGAEAFEIAAKRNVPVLVSIGYAACHWCHVMAHESFNDPQIAAFMNAHFVNVKVDREEHPDVDQFCMDALLSMTQQGGWPLNVFMTADKHPFYGGTYFPPNANPYRNSWKQVITAIHNLWVQDKQSIMHQSAQLVQHLKQIAQVESVNPAESLLLDAAPIMAKFRASADTQFGGYNAAPKFPQPLLLELAFHLGNEIDKHHAHFTLCQMAQKGLYDCIEGGFFRYSTDQYWHIPHFEKMLYDNAQLLSVYCKAYLVHNNPLYLNVIEQTWSFLNEHFKTNEGLFISSLDADTIEGEGAYYTLSSSEIKDLDLPQAIKIFWCLNQDPNMESRFHLFQQEEVESIKLQFNLTDRALNELLNESIQKVITLRKSKTLPSKDKKCILSWNALMLNAILDLYRIKEDALIKEQAAEMIHSIWTCFFQQDKKVFYRIYNNNHAHILATLEDLAYLLSAIINYSKYTCDTQFLNYSTQLIQYINAYFKNSTSPLYFYSSNQQLDLPFRKPDTIDNVLPSANAILASSMWTIGILSNNIDYQEKAKFMVKTIYPQIIRYPNSYAQWVIGLQLMQQETLEVIYYEPDDKYTNTHRLNKKSFLPLIYQGTHKNSSNEHSLTLAQIFKDKKFNADAYVWVCKNGICDAPTDKFPL